MIEASLVFKNRDGNIEPTHHYSFVEFMRKWAKGELRRDIDVQVEPSPLFVVELWEAFLDLHQQLSLANRVLARLNIDDVAFPVFLNDDNQKIYPELYTVAATLDAPVEATQQTAYNILVYWLREITNRDNTAILQLLHESSQTKDVLVFNQFTLNVWATLRNAIWQWALPVNACVGTADAFSRLDIKESGITLDTQLPTLAGIPLACVGSPHDLIYPMRDNFSPLYMCATPERLGVRVVREDLTLHSDLSVSTTIATAIVSNKAVEAGAFL